jgi:hypothetical protein
MRNLIAYTQNVRHNFEKSLYGSNTEVPQKSNGRYRKADRVGKTKLIILL